MSSASESDLQSFRSTAERFAKKELDPKAIDLDNYPFKPFNQAALALAREAGLLQIMLPEQQGGAGQGMAALCEILMATAQADASFAAVVFIHSLSLSALVRWGKKPAIDKHSGAGLIAFPVYDLPTDLAGDLSAEKSGAGWALKGRVEYLPLAPVASALIVPARIQGSGKVGLFILDSKTKGVSVGNPLISLGLRNCPVADVNFEGVSAIEDALLCADAGADYPALAARFRAAAAAMSVGVVRGSYEKAKAYAQERYQGGKMIIEHDMVRLMISGLAALAESGQCLVRSMAAAADGGKSFPVSGAGLILLTEQASRATTDGVQCLGGYGYMEDYGQEKRMRDAKQIEAIFGAAPAKRLELMAEILKLEG